MPPSPPPEEETNAGRVLGPDELDIERRENVVPIDEGRYVIASDVEAAERAAALASGPTTSDDDADGSTDNADGPADDESSTDGTLTLQHIERWQERALRGANSHYGLRLSAKSGEAVGHQRMLSDNVTTVFDGLLTWYAGQLDGETPVEDVLGILLAESNIRVRYPAATIRELVATHGLSLDDSIGDLFEATADGDKLVFPPEEGETEFLFPPTEATEFDSGPS